MSTFLQTLPIEMQEAFLERGTEAGLAVDSLTQVDYDGPSVHFERSTPTSFGITEETVVRVPPFGRINQILKCGAPHDLRVVVNPQEWRRLGGR